VLVPVEFEPRSLEPDDGPEPEPEPDDLVDVLPEEEEAEAAGQDEEVPVLAPAADPSAAVLPWPVPDDDDAPVVGAAVELLAEGHPAVELELDDDEDGVVGAGGAGAVEPVAEEPPADGAEDELAEDEPAEDELGEDEPAEEDPAGVEDEEPEELLELVLALADWPDVALADCPELPEVVVEAPLDELDDVPLGAEDPCVAVEVVVATAGVVVPEADPAGVAETRLVLVETDVPITLCSDDVELTPAASAPGAISTSVSTAAARQRQKMPRARPAKRLENLPLSNQLPPSTKSPPDEPTVLSNLTHLPVQA
jgi:hypothetical protein